MRIVFFTNGSVDVQGVMGYPTLFPKEDPHSYATITTTDFDGNVVTTQSGVVAPSDDDSPVQAGVGASAIFTGYANLKNAGGAGVSFAWGGYYFIASGGRNVTVTIGKTESGLPIAADGALFTEQPYNGGSWAGSHSQSMSTGDVLIPNPFNITTTPVFTTGEIYPRLKKMDLTSSFTFSWGGNEETTNDTIWKLDNNNHGYPWIWGYTYNPIPKSGILYLKTETGLVMIKDYLKTEDGLVPLLDYLKTENGLVPC